ncbi:MAG: acetyltransferase [Gammaproteobacteria bacterium]
MPSDTPITPHQHRLAETIRQACIEAALQGYENAAISGLCHEGAWEAAISAIRMVDVDDVIREHENSDQPAKLSK